MTDPKPPTPDPLACPWESCGKPLGTFILEGGRVGECGHCGQPVRWDALRKKYAAFLGPLDDGPTFTRDTPTPDPAKPSEGRLCEGCGEPMAEHGQGPGDGGGCPGGRYCAAREFWAAWKNEERRADDALARLGKFDAECCDLRRALAARAPAAAQGAGRDPSEYEALLEQVGRLKGERDLLRAACAEWKAQHEHLHRDRIARIRERDEARRTMLDAAQRAEEMARIGNKGLIGQASIIMHGGDPPALRVGLSKLVEATTVLARILRDAAAPAQAPAAMPGDEK